MAPPVTTSRDWIPSAETRRSMDAASVRYTEAPFARDVPSQYRGLTRTQYPIGAGTRALRNYLVQTFGRAGNTAPGAPYMPGRSRAMLPGQQLDQHQWGHAIDYMTANVALGTRIAEFLVANADSIGVQYVVFAGNRWSQGQPPGARRFAAYEGSNKHRDHLHIELNTDGAEGRLPWFQGRLNATPSQLLADASSANGSPPLGDDGPGWPVVRIAAVTAGGVALVTGAAIAARRYG